MQTTNSASPVSADRPDSATILLGAAGNAAYERRNKNIMHCFRDRTPSYSRSAHPQQLVAVNISGRTRQEAIIYLKEPRPINKLALLKSASTRDLTRLLLDESKSNTSTNSSGSSTNCERAHEREREREREYCEVNCMRRIGDLEQRVAQLEQQLQEERNFAKQLQGNVQELMRRVEQLSATKLAEKRKKSSSMRRKATANGNAPAVQPSKLVAWMNLSNWWKHRPSIETLKEQNIYNDEPCFDTEIEMVLKHEVHKTVPKIVVDCCDLIEEQYRNSTIPVEGIYRQCGDYNKIQTLRFRIDANDYESLRQPNVDIHTLTGVLKLFLREIKSPLVSTNEAKTFIGKPNQWLLTELSAKIDILKRLIRSLPEVNRDTMEYLFAHFNKLTKVPLQQISAETLSLSVTPSIFHTVQRGVHMQDIHTLLKESEILADCVKIMIEYHSRIFECAAERRQRRISVRKLRKTLSHPDLVFQNFF